jgi:pimeloyl-ACP methyl ester carboxylesterase
MSVLSWRGLDVEYSDVGEGPAVILVHGGANNNRQWSDLIDQLKDRYRVLAVNLRSTGKTTGWPENTPQPLTAQTVLLEGLVDLVGEAVTLVGHSYGATISMRAALEFGEQIDRLVLIEPNPFFLLKRAGYEDGLADINIMSEPFQRLGHEKRWSEIGVHFIDYWFGAGSWQAMDAKRQNGISTMMPVILDAWEGCMNDPSDVEEWKEFADRILLITSADTRLSVKRIRDQMRNFLPGLTCEETPEGGHMAAVQRPDLVSPVVAAFLDQSSSSAKASASNS